MPKVCFIASSQGQCGAHVVCAAGIAWDDTRKRLFVTGKYWPRIFEITPKPLDPNNEKYKQLVKRCYVRQ
jgi:hypothetical protein